MNKNILMIHTEKVLKTIMPFFKKSEMIVKEASLLVIGAIA